MTAEKFLNKYRISSARAPWHGYDGGIYFITICTVCREHFFGEIVVEPSQILETVCNLSIVETLRKLVIVETLRATSLPGEPQMQLSPIGKYAHDQVTNVSEHYPYAEIPLFVIMPNHIHAIVMVDGENVPYRRRDAAEIGGCDNAAPVNNIDRETVIDANCRDVAQIGDCRDVARNVSTATRDMKQIANMQSWLTVVVRGLKSSITRYAHENNIPFAWQTRFYDRIVRNQDELNRIAQYIEQNVAKWKEDKLLK